MLIWFKNSFLLREWCNQYGSLLRAWLLDGKKVSNRKMNHAKVLWTSHSLKPYLKHSEEITLFSMRPNHIEMEASSCFTPQRSGIPYECMQRCTCLHDITHTGFICFSPSHYPSFNFQFLYSQICSLACRVLWVFLIKIYRRACCFLFEPTKGIIFIGIHHNLQLILHVPQISYMWIQAYARISSHQLAIIFSIYLALTIFCCGCHCGSTG